LAVHAASRGLQTGPEAVVYAKYPTIDNSNYR